MKGGIHLSSLAFNKPSSLDERIKNESGDRSYPIWLLANPKDLGVRLNVWVPILEEIQDKVFRKLHSRIDTKPIFIKNVIRDAGLVSKSMNWESAEVTEEIEILRESVLQFQPKILITFGSTTYEFVRRVLQISDEKEANYWSDTDLGNEFERAIANFDINQTNRIPLLSRVMMSGKFFEDRDYSGWEDGETYFQGVTSKIANKIIENRDSLNIWIDKFGR